MIAERFLEWMDHAPAERRAEGANALTRAYLHSSLSTDDRVRLEAVMTVLLDDPSSKVRASVSDALASDPDAPRHLILALASDQLSVAEPVLLRSPVLDDSDLVDLVAMGPQHRQILIARRFHVGRAVSAALAEVGEQEAVCTLLENYNARIAPISVDRIVQRFGDEPDVRQRLLDREDLPIEVRQVLVQRLAQALRSLVTDKEWLKPERALTVVREACEKATIGLSETLETDDLDVLVEHLKVSNQLTPALLLRALCLGRIHFIECAIASLSKLPLKRVCALLHSGRAASVQAVCRQAHLPERIIPALVVGIEASVEMAGEGLEASSYAHVRRMLERVLTKMDDLNRDDANDLLAMLRRFASDAARDAARSEAGSFRSAA